MIRFSEDRLSVAEYLKLRKSVGWIELSERQAELAIENCMYCISAYNDDGKLADLSRNDSDYVDNCLRFIVHMEKDHFVITFVIS